MNAAYLDVVTGKLDVRGVELPVFQKAVDLGIEEIVGADTESELADVSLDEEVTI